MKKHLHQLTPEDKGDDDYGFKVAKIFIPPVPLTEEQLKPHLQAFEHWVAKVEENTPAKKQVEELYVDAVQRGREIGFEEGFTKGGKLATRHFTVSRERKVATDEELKASEETNKDLVAGELQAVLQQYQIVPDEVKLDAIFDVLQSRFGVKIDRNKDGR